LRARASLRREAGALPARDAARAGEADRADGAGAGRLRGVRARGDARRHGAARGGRPGPPWHAASPGRPRRPGRPGGAPAPLALLALCGPETRLVNSYGVTEVTIDSTFFELVPGSGAMTSSAMVPIGRPFANQEVFVLDGNLGPVPVGLPGELCLGGAGVARG